MDHNVASSFLLQTMNSVLMMGLQKLGWRFARRWGMTQRPVLWCCLIEFSIPWWKPRECGRKRVFDSILAFLRHCPADWAAEAVGFLLCLPSDRHSQLTRCPPTVWLGSLCPSLSYGDEEFLVFVPRFLSQGPHPVLLLSMCGHISLPAG